VPEALALVADVGRLSVRFGLTGGELGFGPRDVRRYMTAEHSTFTSALCDYLRDCGLENRQLPSVLAVAGVARGDLINLTGSRWYISLAGIEAVLRERPQALNECTAKALALTRLPASAFAPLPGPRPKPLEPGGNFVVIGTGTGLGVAALVTVGDRLVPIQTEAGHMAFTPETKDEERFAAFCIARGQAPDVEALISAPGLMTAYEALSGGRRLGSPEEVTRNIGRDPIADQVTRMMIDALGAFAGNLALAYGAWDGVFLTGPIARALQPQLAQPGFRRRMENKAAFRRQLGEIPVMVVTQTDLELIGAAAAIEVFGSSLH
jgi:glucokinase